MDNHIICPNCGAPNDSTSTSCQFCGTPLVATKPETNKKKKSESSSEVSVREIKGKPQIKFDERIFHLNYDELSGSTTLYISCFGVRAFFGGYSFDCKELQIHNIKAIISDGKRYDFHGDIKIGTDNLNLLETFCNLDWKNCKILGFREGEEMLFVLICQAYYNTIFDHSKYTNATDKLYEYYLQCIAQKNKEEEEKSRKIRKETEEYFKKERIKGCLTFAIIIISSSLLLGLAFFLAHIFS